MFESNNANNIMQEEQSFEFLDVLAIVSFMAQINNMNKDVKYFFTFNILCARMYEIFNTKKIGKTPETGDILTWQRT